MKPIIFRVTDITRDRRNRQQLEKARMLDQDRLDQALERHYNERVRLNVQRRLNRRVDEILQMSTDGSQPDRTAANQEFPMRTGVNTGVRS